MILECANCREKIKVPEKIVFTENYQFICHLCHTKQTIKTVSVMEEKIKTGKLNVFRNGQQISTHDIYMGENKVGRISKDYKSHIEIDDKDLSFSRQHFVIKADKNEHGIMEHTVYLDRGKNKTIIRTSGNERVLQKTDKILLSNRDKIIIGEESTVFIFEADYHEEEEKKEEEKGSTISIK